MKKSARAATLEKFCSLLPEYAGNILVDIFADQKEIGVYNHKIQEKFDYLNHESFQLISFEEKKNWFSTSLEDLTLFQKNHYPNF